MALCSNLFLIYPHEVFINTYEKNITLVCVLWASLSLSAQPVGKKAALEGRDYTESISYNDAQRGAVRRLQYYPEGEDFVCVNGKNRYTRALYGSHTAYRLETSDRPVLQSITSRKTGTSLSG